MIFFSKQAPWYIPVLKDTRRQELKQRGIPTFHEKVHCCFLSLILYLLSLYVHVQHMQTMVKPGPEVIKLFSCSAQLRLKFILLINVKMPTIVGILTFISRINYRLWCSKPLISIYLGYFSIYEDLKFQAQLS